MGLRRLLAQSARKSRKALHILAAPVKGDSGRGGVFIQAYRGYGSREKLYLMGRVFRQPGFASHWREGPWKRDLLDLLRRLLRKGVVNAKVRVRYKGAERLVRTDRYGFFHVRMDLTEMPSDYSLWHRMTLELVDPVERRAKTTGEFFVPPDSARYGVISDIDDTVVYTGVANTFMMMWRLFAQGAESRIAFPGVAALYKAFYDGVSGEEHNPLLYVSRGPWSIYGVLDEFFRLHRIPNGPILFLREWGLKRGNPWPRRAKNHKLKLIRDMLALYRHLPFVLVGDSGQRDPEVYLRILREHPGRIPAIYIRNVSRDPRRQHTIRELAREAAESGCNLILATDSQDMARHAVEHNLISADALADVRREHDRDEEA